ncbi:hypothetical protein V7x_15120 [Crateriforma conspicua]|uniref:Uncharacterized protein n=1 Tax=Crateriforma conspicua TaxID=2527996 RepID=A0A5C6FUB3_9PLAN|nr:hypothetical protein [Crateriforma conspicua]TWU65956.1 hypothetical protein V7x_15120 [Crateriforma conspicua]
MAVLSVSGGVQGVDDWAHNVVAIDIDIDKIIARPTTPHVLGQRRAEGRKPRFGE